MAENLLAKTEEFCRFYGIKPARSRGQNFLIKEEIYDQIVERADLKSGETVLEVGPGWGFLTARLAAKAKRVVAVELDDKLTEALRIGLAARGARNVEVVNEDILKFSTFSLPGKYKIVANLPYNITSIFLRKFLTAENKPELMVLMLQREVAERITAGPGKMSLLALSAQFYAQPEIARIVPKESFWPRPEVDSAIIRLKIKNEQPAADEKKFFQLAKFGFSARRKMLKNNLAAGFKIKPAEAEKRMVRASFKANLRAQELSVEDWLKLFSVFVA